jgi:hypothetical protein
MKLHLLETKDTAASFSPHIFCRLRLCQNTGQHTLAFREGYVLENPGER